MPRGQIGTGKGKPRETIGSANLANPGLKNMEDRLREYPTCIVQEGRIKKIVNVTNPGSICEETATETVSNDLKR